MNRRQPNPRLAKIHYAYTAREVADLYGVHKNTVREWIKSGLPICNDRRPFLILGSELRAFLESRRASKKHPCGPGEFFCFRCHVPKPPAGGMVDYVATSDTLGKPEDAKQRWLSAFADSAKTRNLVLQADTLVSLFTLAQASGKMDEALDLAVRALDLARKSKSFWIQSRCLAELSRLQLAMMEGSRLPEPSQYPLQRRYHFVHAVEWDNDCPGNY